jgi:hypothetical protein
VERAECRDFAGDLILGWCHKGETFTILGNSGGWVRDAWFKVEGEREGTLNLAQPGEVQRFQGCEGLEIGVEELEVVGFVSGGKWPGFHFNCEAGDTAPYSSRAGVGADTHDRTEIL